MDSILDSVKKCLGIPKEYQVFDQDIIMHINSVFFTLNQLGVGPEDSFSISDSSSVWTDFIPEGSKLEAVKSYMYLKVRMLFDPPTSSFVLTSMENMAKEYEWRLTVQAESSL